MKSKDTAETIAKAILEMVIKHEMFDIDSYDSKVQLLSDGSVKFILSKYDDLEIPGKRCPQPIGNQVFTVTVSETYEKLE
jgi:hypothetical protein